jgi:hypothetical protein
MGGALSQRIPFARVLVEGCVIVGSIRLAFSFDAWWGEVQEARRVTAALEGVHEELVSNAEEMALVARRHRMIYEGGLRVLGVAVGAAEPDSMFASDARWVLAGEMWLDVATDALDRVLISDASAPGFDTDLRTRLAGYRSGLDQVWQQEAMVRSLVRGDLTRELSQRFDLLFLGTGSLSTGLDALRETHAPDDPVAYLLGVIRDPVIRNLVTARLGREYQAMWRMERLHGRYDSLVTELAAKHPE